VSCEERHNFAEEVCEASMSGVGLLVKTFTPRRSRRRGGSEKRTRLELSQDSNPPDLVAGCEAPPITPPPAFLPPGYAKALGQTQHPYLYYHVYSTPI
jgi:hypothetical protein